LPLQVLAAYLAGAFVVLAARGPLSKTWEPLRTRYFTAVLVLTGSAPIPAGLVLYALYPDWSWMYFVNPAQVPLLIGLLAVLLGLLGASVMGFFVTHRLMRRRPRLLPWTLWGSGLLFVLILVAGRNRLGRVAHYDAFHYGGTSLALTDSPLLLTLLVLVPAVLGMLVFTCLMVARHVEGAHRPARSLPPTG
jgi:hypothetical protein